MLAALVEALQGAAAPKLTKQRAPELDEDEGPKIKLSSPAKLGSATSPGSP